MIDHRSPSRTVVVQRPDGAAGIACAFGSNDAALGEADQVADAACSAGPTLGSDVHIVFARRRQLAQVSGRRPEVAPERHDFLPPAEAGFGGRDRSHAAPSHRPAFESRAA